MPQPVLCRPEAFRLFAQQLPELEKTDNLLNAAVAISMHSRSDVTLESVDQHLHCLAERVRSRARSGRPQAILAHLHQAIFEEERFTGNTEDYYSPLNSYLPTVLETRRGLPVTLVLIYKVVANRVGLEVEGVNSPGHFLARVRSGCDIMLVDPFFGGALLTEEEALERVGRVLGRRVRRHPLSLPTATHGQWLSRILLNLQNSLAALERQTDLAAMTELQVLLQETLRRQGRC